MGTSKRKHKSSERKDFERRLALLNCRRSLLLAVFLSLLLAVFYFSCRGQERLPYLYSAMLIVIFTVELASAVLLFYIIRNVPGWQMTAYRVYYIVTLAAAVPVSIADYTMSGSLMTYVLLLGAAVFVPVLQRSEQNAQMVLMAVVTTACSVCAAKNGNRAVVEFVVIGILAMAAGRYGQQRFRNYEKCVNDSRGKYLLSDVDPLTGLTNKSGLINTAGIMWRFCVRNRSMAGAIFIDVDYFKNYNDTFGHEQGDETLKSIAGVVADCARRDTDTVARVGGEAFFVLVQGVEKEKLVGLALKIRSAIAQLGLEQGYNGSSKYVTVSIGAACAYPDKGDTFKNLYEASSDAMYLAKDNGRNCIVCDGVVYGRMKNGIGTAIDN